MRGLRILGVIQARMSSTRLPGKVLLELPGDGETVLSRVVRAARAAEGLDDLVVATTTEAGDDSIAARCKELDVPVHRGAVDDVLSRFLGALVSRPADAVLRITADCPLLHPGTITTATAAFRAVEGLDYLSTGLVRTLPRGMDVEIASATALREADRQAKAHHRVHVTSYIYSHPQRFRLLGLDFVPDLGDLRVTLDTPEDWAVVRHLVEAFGRDQPSPDVVGAWLAAHPEIAALNADIRQKALDEG